MGAAEETARALRAAVEGLPQGVVSGFADDLDATQELLAGTLSGSQYADDVLGVVAQVRDEITRELAQSMKAAETAVHEVADIIATPDAAPSGGDAPTEPPVSRKVDELRGRPRARHKDKDIEREFRKFEEAGWVIEKTKGNHFDLWGPKQGQTYNVGSTPGRATLNGLRNRLSKFQRTGQ